MSEPPVNTLNFKEKAIELLPEGASFEACLTCGLCSSGCPASGIENMDPRKFIRMAMLGMDEELSTTPWVWCCTQCKTMPACLSDEYRHFPTGVSCPRQLAAREKTIGNRPLLPADSLNRFDQCHGTAA